MKVDIKSLDETQKLQLVALRWASSAELWEVVEHTYKNNTAIYANKADWLGNIPEKRRKYQTQANRIFVNMEAVINSLIANPPGINIIPSRDGDEAQDFARKLESFFRKKFVDRNTKEVLRMGLRNLYFARLLVIKPFWNPMINDFDFRAVDPRKIRVAKYARKEQDSEFAIEEIEDNLCALVARFPEKKEALMKKCGITDEADMYVKNPDLKYKESWIQDYVIFSIDNILLGCIKNPYWDWDGILITEEEEQELNGDGTENNPGLTGDSRRQKLQQVKVEQDQRKAQALPTGDTEDVQEGEVSGQEPTTKFKPFYFNYFDTPRKPYIIATIFNNENSPIGRTDMITLAAELQRGIDKRKMDIDENCEIANGIIKVDAEVMSKSDAQRIRFETRGIIWGKGVVNGVQREVGQALPQMVFEDMIDSRQEIDNIMAATSAFRGEREGQETKAGRLALIQQSFLRLNELVQVVDYVSGEIFNWGMQLAKTRYTEYHYAKWMGREGAREVIELIQDDFETGSEITVIAGKTLPVDDEFKFEQAQNDVLQGFISPADYLEIAKYDNAKELAKNAVLYKQNPMAAVGIGQDEMPVPFMPGTLTPDQVAASDPNAGGQVPPMPPM
tara:strand:- start:9715 stop:11568 length:1854 start_codon:yes stop_codon:yes gene_type:complete